MQHNLKILLVDDDEEFCEDMAVCFEKTEGLELVSTTGSAAEALAYVKDHRPDAVVLDLELHKGCGDGITFLRQLNALRLPKRPYVMVNTHNSSRTTHEIVEGLGADFVMYKHQEGYGPEEVAEFLLAIRAGSVSPLHKHPSPSDQDLGQTLRTRILRELDKVYVNPKNLGYQYLADAIEICCGGLTTNVSAIIGEKYGKSEASVERAMQNAIDKAWSSADINELLEHYTAHINPKRSSPTVTEFICYYASKLRRDG